VRDEFGESWRRAIRFQLDLVPGGLVTYPHPSEVNFRGTRGPDSGEELLGDRPLLQRFRINDHVLDLDPDA
jgi:hypothetical protein